MFECDVEISIVRNFGKGIPATNEEYPSTDDMRALGALEHFALRRSSANALSPGER
jgi:hypothetical protein